MTLANDDSRMANLHLTGVEERTPARELGATFAEQLARWRRRKDPGQPGAELLRTDDTAHFVIDREGLVREYWPAAGDNDLSESLFREFSQDERVWERPDEEPVCVEVSYQVFSEPGSLEQVLCPWRDGEGRVAGFVVVTNRSGSGGSSGS